MTFIEVLTIGLPLARWLAVPRQARVTVRFDATLHLQDSRGTLCALTTHPNPGAFRVVTPTLPPWEPGTRVQMRDGELGAADVVVRWGAPALWDPLPQRRVLNVGERRTAVRQLAGLLSDSGLPSAHAFWDLLADTWHSIVAALRGQDLASLTLMMTRLIGYGPGLTPTGDDFTQALLVTLHTGDDLDRAAFRLLARSVTPLLPRTTRTSQVFLQEALRGWTFGPLKTLLEALPRVPAAAVQALLRVGASSGPAYAFGVLLGLATGCER